MRDRASGGIASLRKGLDVLFLLSDLDRLGVRQIAERVRMPVSTAYRLIRTLARAGALEQDPATRKYRLGLRLLALEASILRHLDVRRIALPYMNALAERWNETVLLTLRNEFQGVCIEAVESSEPLRVAPTRGQVLPLHAGALEKAILAFLPRAEIDQYLKSGRLVRLRQETITDPDLLTQELARIRKRGYATSTQEVYKGARGIAAPIFDNTGMVIGSLGISGPTSRISMRKVPQVAAEIVKCAKNVSIKLGQP